MAGTLKKYEHVVIATDVVIFTILDRKLQVLLIQLKKTPFTGFWAAPGGLVNPKESLEHSAMRQLTSKTGVKDVYLEQLYSFGDVDRDPFGRVVSVAYSALISPENIQLKTSEEYSAVKWFPVSKLPVMAYDHKKMIMMAYERLQSKLGYTNIVYSLLPKEFTLTQLQTLYETILAKKFDKRNFRKKFLSLKLIKKTGKKWTEGASRPAELYTFVKRKAEVISIL